jgi:capsular exopolysaccharide synthesis family protein
MLHKLSDRQDENVLVPEIDTVHPRHHRAEIPLATYQPANLLRYLQIASRRKQILFALTVAGTITGSLLALAQRPMYKAETSLEIENLDPNYVHITETTPEPITYEALTDIKTQTELFHSKALITRVLTKLHWRPSDRDAAGLHTWRGLLHIPLKSPTLSDAVRDAATRLEVQAPMQTRIVHIWFEAADPRWAANFLNTLANEFIQSNLDARWNTSEHTSKWLEKKLEETRLKLERSEANLQAYVTRTGLLYNTDRSTISEEKLRQLQAELTRAQAERAEKKSRYELSRSVSVESLPEVLNDPSLREYQLRLTELRRQMAESATLYTAKNPKMQRLEAQVQTLQTAVERERAATVTRIQNEYETATRQENLLVGQYASQLGVVNRDAGFSVQYGILRRDVESNRELYDSMLRRVKESNIASALKASNIRVVDPAEPPLFPYKPRFALSSALGTLTGLFCGLVFVFVREHVHVKLEEPGEASLCVNTPELGVIISDNRPWRNHKHSTGVPRRAALHISPAPSSSLDIAGHQPSPERVELITVQHKSSPTASSFRNVVASLLFSESGHRESGHRAQALVLSSAADGEGKTTVTSNLGIALAEIKKSVLLIDGDLHRPHLHEVFNVSNEPGLSGLLSKEKFDPVALKDAVHETCIPAVSVLPAGSPSGTATTLLYSENLAVVLERLRREFDFILIDTPPALVLPDARVLARLADSVILVGRSGATPKSALQMVRQRFEDDSTPVMGVVLNDWDPKFSPASRYGYRMYSS